jgi:DNA polymerase-4
MDKPDGLTFIGPSRVESFMEALPVEKFFGVGKVTATKMKNMGIHQGADLKALTEGELTRHFGKSGKFFYRVVRGIDDRAVQPHRETKSVGAEDTFPYDLEDPEEMHSEINRIAMLVADRLHRHGLSGRTITLKIKYHDFKQITRSQSYDVAAKDFQTIASTARKLLDSVEFADKKIRLLGITMSNFPQNLDRGSGTGAPDNQLPLGI